MIARSTIRTVLAVLFTVLVAPSIWLTGAQSTPTSNLEQGAPTPDPSQRAMIAPPTSGFEFEVREVNDVDVDRWPTTVVIPLPYGQFQDTASMRIYDPDPAVLDNIPAQFEIVDRWYAKDNSIRHVAAHFHASVGPKQQKAYRFHWDGGDVGSGPSGQLSVQDNTPSGFITVTTGPLKFTVDKQAGNLLDEVYYDADGDGTFEATERIIGPDKADHGGRFLACAPANVRAGNCDSVEAQHDVSLGAPTVEIEESGPVRAVIRMEVASKYNDVDNDHDVSDPGDYHRHGYAVRLYAYAGRADIKVDYQVQNSAMGPNLWGGGAPRRWSNPLYFDSLDLQFGLDLGSGTTVTTGLAGGAVDRRSLDGNGVEFGYTFHDQYRLSRADGSGQFAACADSVTDEQNDCDTPGFMDVSGAGLGVQVSYRNMWEMWPSGIEIDGSQNLAVQLFPSWGRQHGSNVCSEDMTTTCHYNNECSGSCITRFHDSEAYWLDDMRHVYKELLFSFHDGSSQDAEMTSRARTFDRHPVPVVPMSWYNETGVTMDLDALNPLTANDGSGRLLESNSALDMNENEPQYRFGWNRWFMPMYNRFYDTGDSGDGPPSAWFFLVTGDPADYWHADRMTISEMNIRPQWMTGYTHDRDWDALGLTEAGYGHGNWRAQRSSESSNEVYSVTDSRKMAYARDGQHFWAWHVFESYYFNYNLWVRDWAEFLKEFRRAKLRGVEPYPQPHERAEGHHGFTGWMAYRVTGDTTLLDDYYSYVANDRRAAVSNVCGYTNNKNSSSSFQKGWWTRALANLATEVRPDAAGNGRWDHWAAYFALITGYMEWEQHYSNFSYLVNEAGWCSTKTRSAGSSWPAPDSQSWYYAITGKERFQDQTRDFVDGGLGGGSAPYPGALLWTPTGMWDGRHASRAYYAVENDPRADRNPPSAPTGVRASTTGNGSVTVSWNAVPDADKYFVVVSDRTLIECTSNCANDSQSTDPSNYRNWWAAESIGATRGTSIVLPAVGSGTNYAAVFAFDDARNMSVISEVATSTSGPPDSTPPTDPSNLVATVTSATTVELTWTGSTDNVGVEAYRVFRDGALLASTSATSYQDATASPSTTYAYHVTARDTSGNESGASNTAAATTPTLEVPDPPVLEIQGNAGS